MSDTIPDLISTEELAERLKLHPVTIRKRCGGQRPEWPSTLIGRRLMFTDRQVAEIIELCARPAGTVIKKRRRPEQRKVA